MSNDDGREESIRGIYIKKPERCGGYVKSERQEMEELGLFIANFGHYTAAFRNPAALWKNSVCAAAGS